MKKTLVKKTIGVPAEDAWEVISMIKGIEDYLPGVSSSEVHTRGAYIVRSINLLDGSQYEEVIKKVDHENMELLYIISDPSPFSYSKFKGSIKVIHLTDDACEICWSCCYDPEDGPAEEIDVFLSLIISMGIKGVEKLCRKMMALG
jgi:hypothetical protein